MRQSARSSSSVVGNLISDPDKEKYTQIVNAGNEFKTNLHDSNNNCST